MFADDWFTACDGYYGATGNFYSTLMCNFFSAKSLIFHGCKIFCCWLVNVVSI